MLGRIISSSTDHYDIKHGKGGGKSTQILEATKLSCADYNQCGHTLSKYLSSYVYASSDHFWGFVVTRCIEIGLNVWGKGPRVNEHLPMHQLVILSMGWAAFFHPASISQLFLVSYQWVSFWVWFFLNLDFHTIVPKVIFLFWLNFHLST